MPIPLTVNGNTYNYPVAGEDPNWGKEASDWALEVTNVLASVLGDGDILEDNFPIINNANVYTDISKLNFNPNVVRSALISYVIHRTFDLATQVVDFSASVHADFVNQVGAQATGTVTIVDYSLLAGATITVNGTALVEGVDWAAAVDNDTTATSLASAIDALALVGAVSALNVVTITADANGTAANSYNLLTSDAVNAPVSAATLLGGIDDVVAPAKYFTLTSANDVTSYYFWMSESPNDVDPAVVGMTGVPVVLIPSFTLSDILQTIRAAVNSTLDFNSTEDGVSLTVIAAAAGPITIVQTTNIPNSVMQPYGGEITYGATESGEIQLTQLVPVNNIFQWDFTQTAYGSGGVSLSITPTGQLQYQSTNIIGANYTGKITFAAKVLNV